MKKKYYLIIFTALLTVLSLFYISNSKSSSKPEVLTTIAPYKYFIERLTDHTVEVKTLVPVEADPHGFEPAAKEMVNLFSAKVWFLVGEPFEGHFLPILKRNNPHLEAVHLKENLSLLKVSCCHDHDVEDLHFWMSPKIAKAQCQKMASVLKVQFPEKADLIEEQLIHLNADFDRLDHYLALCLKDKKDHHFLVSHPAFGYFAKEYDLHQLSLENEGQDPSAKELSKLLQEVKNHHIQQIYVQKQYNYKASEIVARSLNLKMVEVNPYAEDYFANMYYFADQFNEAHHD